MSEKADLEVVNRTLAAVVQKQEEELKQARADYERLRSRMALWSHAIKMAQDNEREIERLRAALKRAAKELELLYFFAISNGIAEAGIPPHVEARAALAQPAEGEK